MKIPRILKPLLKLTKDEKSPTDVELDDDISRVGFIFHEIYPLLKRIIKKKILRFFKYNIFTILRYILYVSLILTLSYFAWIKIFNPVVIVKDLKQKKEIYYHKLRSFKEFVDKVTKIESGGDYGIISDNGMLGAYQFHPKTLRYTGINISSEDFLSNKELQDGAFIQSLKITKRSYKKYIDKYNMKEIPGIKGTVTTSGILMTFHLKPDDAISFFESNGSKAGVGDGNGKKVADQLEEFSGYEIPF